MQGWKTHPCVLTYRCTREFWSNVLLRAERTMFKIKRLFLPFLVLSGSLAIVTIAASTSANQKRPSKIVAFGTSLTARGGWQESLAERLSACLGWSVIVDTVAKSGAPSSWGLGHVNEVIRLKPDVILVEFYVNDAALNRFTSVSTSGHTIGAILSSLRSGLPNARIIMQIMNPVSGMAGMARPFFSRYIDAHVRQARENGVDVLDHRKRWTSLSADELAKAIPDGLHPTPEAATSIMIEPLVAKISGVNCWS